MSNLHLKCDIGRELFDSTPVTPGLALGKQHYYPPKFLGQNPRSGNFPDGSVAKTLLPVWGAQAQSLVKELAPHIPQLKILHATTKTPVQPNK